MHDLTGKTALVTGGGRDIGRAMSIALAAAGAQVIVNYHSSDDEAAETLTRIEAAGGRASACRADITEADGIERLATMVRSEFAGRLDILVNNAGGLIGRRPIEAFDLEFVETVMRLNFTSAVMVTHALIGFMSSGASIVNMASLAGRNGGASGAAIYAASKAAVMTFTRGLAKELGPRGIRANCLCPGLIDTRFHDSFSSDEERQRTHQLTPLRREGTPREVGDPLVFLASDASSYMTGVSLDVNGGLGFY